MQNVERKGLELINKLIRSQSGVDNQTEQSKCAAWFYQPKRPEKITENKL